jgi:predicted phosphodiesterase
MRVALISDVHANLTALDAVLAHAGARGIEAVWQLGDIVGYGPDPDAVVRRLKECAAAGVMGNHDAAAVGLMPLDDFNPTAAEANRWTAGQIDADSAAYLRSLPEVELDGEYTRVHGTLRGPLWEYMTTHEIAEAHFRLQQTPICVVGHTHLPAVVYRLRLGQHDSIRPADGEVFELGEGQVCVNPGGLGQPRDGDPRAPYAILDTSAATVTFHRVAYDIPAVQERIIEAGLPETLATRLARGR